MGGFLYDLSGLLAIFFVGSIVLTPLLALTLRFALKPLIESVARLQGSDKDDAIRLLAGRVDTLEAELGSAREELDRLRAASDFDRQLKAPSPGDGS